MPFAVEFSAESERDFELIFDHLHAGPSPTAPALTVDNSGNGILWRVGGRATMSGVFAHAALTGGAGSAL